MSTSSFSIASSPNKRLSHRIITAPTNLAGRIDFLAALTSACLRLLYNTSPALLHLLHFSNLPNLAETKQRIHNLKDDFL